MTDSDRMFAGSVPEVYDTYLVPLIFQAYANDLAERAAALEPKAVLETAAGTGVVALALTSGSSLVCVWSRPTSVNRCSIGRWASDATTAALSGAKPTL